MADFCNEKREQRKLQHQPELMEEIQDRNFLNENQKVIIRYFNEAVL